MGALAISASFSTARPLSEPPKEIASFRTSCLDLVYSKGGKRLATFPGNTKASVWDIQAEKCLQTFEFDFSRDGHPAYGQFNGSNELLVSTERDRNGPGWDVWKCDVESGAKERLISGVGHEVVYAIWPDQKLIVVLEHPRDPTGPGDIRFVDIAGKKKDMVVKCDEFYRVLTFSPDRTLVVLQVGGQKPGGKAPQARVVHLATGKVLARFPIGFQPGLCLLSPDNKTLISVPPGFENVKKVDVWSVEESKLLYTLKARESVDRLGDVSPDGRLVGVVTNLGTVQLLDLKARDFAMSFKGAPGALSRFRFAPDGKTFATGGVDGPTRLFETPELQDTKGDRKNH
jgi:WD40 repeat protein